MQLNTSDAAIGGSLIGLDSGAGVVLQNNGGDDLSLTGNGAFAFAGRQTSGSAYNVTVLTQPTGQVCEIVNGTGSVDSGTDDVRTVSVTCIGTTTVGGTVSGLAAGTAVTLNNGAELLPVAANGPFAFAGILLPGTNYAVTVATQPLGATCAVSNGTGTVAAAAVTNVSVACS